MDLSQVAASIPVRSGQPLRVPHCAFDDPSCPAGVTPRSSIEVRGFAFFDA